MVSLCLFSPCEPVILSMFYYSCVPNAQNLNNQQKFLSFKKVKNFTKTLSPFVFLDYIFFS